MIFEELRKFGTVLLAFLTLSLVLSAFSHQAAATQNASVLEQNATDYYLMPGETRSSLCNNSGSDAQHSTDGHCNFCTLSHGVALRNAPLGTSKPRYARYFLQVDERGGITLSMFRPWAPSQGPPRKI